MYQRKVSVIIPILNEVEYISGFLDSLINQDYPYELLEYIFVDGGSVDGTIRELEKFLLELNRPTSNFRILQNPGKTAPYAMNIGIRAALGDIIVRLDVHVDYPREYISKCVYYLENTEADNVGCPRLIKGKGFIGRCIEHVVTSSFGVGGSSYRVGNLLYSKDNEVEYVNTVPLGAFYKTLIDKIGFFDERYPRAEDNDFNYRIRESGGKVLLFKDIHTVYYCRSNIRDLQKMAYGNGSSIGSIFHKNAGITGFKYYIPALFVLTLVIGMLVELLNKCRLLSGKGIRILSYLFRGELLAYLVCSIVASGKKSVKMLERIVTIFLYPIFHISYGIGVIIGFLKRDKDIQNKK